jgi:hypothetical protein
MLGAFSEFDRSAGREQQAASEVESLLALAAGRAWRIGKLLNTSQTSGPWFKELAAVEIYPYYVLHGSFMT